MPCFGVPGAEAAAEGGRDGVIVFPAFKGFGGSRVKLPQYTRPRAGTTNDGRARVRVEGATKAWMTLGGKKSKERLGEIEWL